MREVRNGGVRRARALRRTLSPPELKLWLELRLLSDGRPPFRRQHPIGPYVLDFYCAPARLCVEVDGVQHTERDRPERDAVRDAWLRERGIRVERMWAHEVLASPGDAAAVMLRWVEEIHARKT